MQDTHLHLSGATPPSVLWEIIQNSGFKTKAKDFWHFRESILMSKDNVHNLDEYLDILHTIDRAQSSPFAIEESVYQAFVSSYMAGCEYLELRWNPTKRSQNGRIDLDKLIVSARSGMERAKSIFGIRGKLILCMGRDCSPKANRAVADKALKYAGKGIIGIDLAGPYEWSLYEKQLALFEEIYEECYNRGLTTTIHCGEIDHENLQKEIDWVIDKLKNVERIGHGVQIAMKCPQYLKHFKGKTFEICMSSNLRTGAVNGIDDFKVIFERLADNKIQIDHGTDATFLLGTDISKEYELYESVKAN